MASCKYHPKTKFAFEGVCPRCKSCNHSSLWGSDDIDCFECTNCGKIFDEVPEGKECWILYSISPFKKEWIEYSEYLIHKDTMENHLKDVEQEHIEMSQKINESECLNCKEIFYPKRSTAKFCSDKCKKQFQRNLS